MRKYSVYERGTDRPIIIHGTAAECAAMLGIAKDSFYTLVMRTRKGHPPKGIEIFIDDEEESK